jgi:hypothetical protein
MLPFVASDATVKIENIMVDISKIDVHVNAK